MSKVCRPLSACPSVRCPLVPLSTVPLSVVVLWRSQKLVLEKSISPRFLDPSLRSPQWHFCDWTLVALTSSSASLSGGSFILFALLGSGSGSLLFSFLLIWFVPHCLLSSVVFGLAGGMAGWLAPAVFLCRRSSLVVGLADRSPLYEK